MHPIIKKCGFLLFPIMLLLFLGATVSKMDTMMHTVVAGESLSLICIDYYGYYSKGLGKAVCGDNPTIKDVNLIYPGQKIKLRKPESATADAGAVSALKGASSPAADSNKTEDSRQMESSVFMRKERVTQGVVTCVEGSATICQTSADKKRTLTVNTVVVPGNVIETGAHGRVELIINREAVVRLREKTKLELEAFRNATPKENKTRVGCSIGALWTKVKKFKDRISRFELELPTAVAGVHGTVYESIVAFDNSSEVKVFSGEVAVKNSAHQSTPASSSGLSEVNGPHEVAPPHEVSMEQWTRIVRSMQKITIDKNGKPSEPTAFTRNSTGDWERWNAMRDKRIARLFGEL